MRYLLVVLGLIVAAAIWYSGAAAAIRGHCH